MYAFIVGHSISCTASARTSGHDEWWMNEW